MAFPDPPFDLPANDGDRLLVEYLRRTDVFVFLRDATRKVVDKLEASELRQQHTTLVELWPLVLTDALFCLKEHDDRETRRKGKRRTKISKQSSASLFHASSLGVDELQEVLTGFAMFEGMLYGASPDRYRDHIAHVFRVWVLGHALLERWGWDVFLDPIFAKDPALKEVSLVKAEIECMWAIAGLCHDIGYPLAAIEKINDRAGQTLKKLGLAQAGNLSFSFSQQMLPFHDTIVKFMSSRPVLGPSPEEDTDGKRYVTHLQNKYYLKYLKSFDRLDHGVVSTMLLTKSLVFFLESDMCHDGFQALERLGINIGPGGVICLAEQSLPLTKSYFSIPVFLL